MTSLFYIAFWDIMNYIRDEKYMGTTILDMRELADKLDELFLDYPDTNSRVFQTVWRRL